jgi:hypothetical protein
VYCETVGVTLDRFFLQIIIVLAVIAISVIALLVVTVVAALQVFRTGVSSIPMIGWLATKILAR